MVALASCDHQKSKLRTVAGAEGFWVAELRVRQLKIGSKSCFGYNQPRQYFFDEVYVFANRFRQSFLIGKNKCKNKFFICHK